MIDKTVSHYRIIEELGHGGMGVVYKAEDTKLGRRVALKVLPPECVTDPNRRRRFVQEARAASALNHPNIITIYDIDEADGVHFMTMEYVEGKTLDRLIAGHGLRVSEALKYAVQMATALTKAHSAGIVHRDLKPTNVMVTDDGLVKVLDFGLAKLSEPLPTGEAETVATLKPRTEEGTVVGTVGYMSPEQAEGKVVDARSDIFTFGSVLYEMLTGRKAFQGETKASTIAAILRDEPKPISEVVEGLPKEVERVVKRCLRKDLAHRFQHMDDLKVALQELKEESDSGELARAVASVSPRAGGAAKRTSLLQRRIALAAAVVIAVAFGVAGWFWLHRVPALTERDSILLADFINTTGDPVFDDTLKQALAVKLGESPFLNVVPEDKVQETLRLMNRSPEERVTGKVAREVCQRQGVKAMLAGSISSLGANYVITLDAVNASTGDTLASEQVEARGKEQVLTVLGKAATVMRARLGESLSSIEMFDAPIEQATTSSLEALKAFSLGEAERNKRGNTEAVVPFFKRAVELDPNFALGYARLGTVYENLGETERADAYHTKAFELRDRVSEKEKLYIANHYYGEVTGELGKELETYELWKRIYPRDSIPHSNLSETYGLLGQFDKALQEARETLRLDPNSVFSYLILANAYIGLNRYDEAKAICEKGAAQHPEAMDLRFLLCELAFLEGDEIAVQRHANWAKGKPEEHWMLAQQAWASMFSGRMQSARQLNQRAVDLAVRRGQKETAALLLSWEAYADAEFGNSRLARERATTAMAIARTRDVMSNAACALARSGAQVQAEELVDELARRFRTHTLLNAILLPTAGADIEINRGEPQRAVRLLEESTPYELGRYALFGPICARGQAYLQARDGGKAAVEFQKILDHRGVWPLSPLYPLAQLGLGRATALAGDTAKARRAYQDFFALWKDADSDIPIFQEAKAEYAKLQEARTAAPTH